MLNWESYSWLRHLCEDWLSRLLGIPRKVNMSCPVFVVIISPILLDNFALNIKGNPPLSWISKDLIFFNIFSSFLNAFLSFLSLYCFTTTSLFSFRNLRSLSVSAFTLVMFPVKTEERVLKVYIFSVNVKFLWRNLWFIWSELFSPMFLLSSSFFSSSSFLGDS